MRKKVLMLAALAAAAALLLTGCMDMGALMAESGEPAATMPPMTAPMYTDRETVYRYYNEVTLSDTLETLTERYGEPEKVKGEGGDTYSWLGEDGCGVAVAFFDSGRLRAKVLCYDDIRQLGALSEATSIADVTRMSKSYTYEMTCGTLGGKPMEIAQIVQDTSADPEVKRLFAWCTSKGDVVQVLFSGDEKVESVSYNLVEAE